MGFSSVLRFLDFDRDLFPRWGISYLYRLCQTDKGKEFCLVWILEVPILMTVELNIAVWNEIGESPTLFDSLRLAVDKDELILRGNCSIWMGIVLAQRPLALVLMITKRM